MIKLELTSLEALATYQALLNQIRAMEESNLKKAYERDMKALESVAAQLRDQFKHL